MYNFKIMKHKDVSQEIINQIINIKSINWHYPYESHVKWIEENLKYSDLHLLLNKRDDLVGYLNLITIRFEIDGDVYHGYGVGNVCVTEKGKRYGVTLIETANRFISDNNKIGLLFCESELVSFYGRNNWKRIDENGLKVRLKKDKTEVMVYNYEKQVKQLVYVGRDF